MGLRDNYRRAIQSRTSKRTGGTLRYEGDNPLDKVYAMTDLLGEVRRGMDGRQAHREITAVQKALFALEKSVGAIHPEWLEKLD